MTVIGVATPPRTHLHRHVVWPGLSGHGIALVARLGDWTWEAVGRECAFDVQRARTEDGRPAYLSFHYYRVRASAGFHLRTPTFGDQLTVGTQVLGTGSQSVLTLHRVVLDAEGSAAPAVDASTFWEPPGLGELRVENLNRWISHSGSSNGYLAATTPVGFSLDALPEAPSGAPPRRQVYAARSAGTFRPEGLSREGAPVVLSYEVDPARDINAAGLLYFAAYFGIVDWAVGRAWQAWGRCIPSFLDRVVEDVQLLYEGNADAGATLGIEVTRWRGADQAVEYIDVILHHNSRTLATCTQRLRTPEPAQGVPQ